LQENKILGKVNCKKRNVLESKELEIAKVLEKVKITCNE
jgi:hypothetical protein